MGPFGGRESLRFGIISEGKGRLLLDFRGCTDVLDSVGGGDSWISAVLFRF